jgi:hypothetical protein
MSVEVRRATGDDRERWDSLVERSPHGTPFHLQAFGEVVVEHTDTTYIPLIGYKGQEPVGLFPTFHTTRGPIGTVFSPVPGFKITYQGPAMVNIAKLKQRKKDRRHRQFVEGCLDHLNATVDPRYVHVRTGSTYLDTRPFVHNGYDASVGHTYVVDISSDEESLLNRFSRDARQNVTDEYDGVEIEEGGTTAIRTIHEQVRKRHEQQDEAFDVPLGFVVDLFERMPAGTVRPYVCRTDGDIAGGIIALELDETVYRWIGGSKHGADVPVNDLLDWAIIRDAKTRGVTRYDLVGASEPNIAKYKAKFAPTLELYQQLECGTTLLKTAANLYKRVKK